MPVRDYKVVVCTPAGRNQYMRVLAPRILSDPDVDRWDIWLNTDNQDDIRYIHELCKHPKCRLVEVPTPICHPVAYRIHQFFPTACDPSTVYIRLDDDIVYYELGSMRSLAEYRIDNQQPFLVYGNVVNTALTSREHQRLGRIPHSRGLVGVGCMDAVGWGSSEFARQLHADFLQDPSPYRWELPDITLGPPEYLRHSINVISWLGSDCANWAHTMSNDEEAWLAHQEPVRTQRPNVIAGRCGPFVHYAFYSQRGAGLDDGALLTGYMNLLSPTVDRLKNATEVIASAKLSSLKNPEYLMGLISNIGLYSDGRPMYGEWEWAKAPVKAPGLWQHPEELANFMVWLSDKKPRRVLEIGCFHGFLAVLLHAYLSRFSDSVSYIAADLHKYHNKTEAPGLEWRWGTTSADYVGTDYDLVIIDADHNYAAARADYERMKDCSIIMFHDIRDGCVKREAQNGGVPVLYQELKRFRHGIEFVRSDWENWMGIGVLCT